MTGLLSATGTAPAHTSQVVHGAALEALVHEVDELVRACGAPLTGGGAWTSSRIGHSPGRPWAVAVRDADGRLAAAAVLLDEPEHRTDEPEHRDAPDEHAAPSAPAAPVRTTLASGGDGHRACLPARDDAAARALAAALADELRARHAHAVELGPLTLDTTALALVSALHPDLTARPVDPIPAIVKIHGSEAARYLSPGCRRTLRKARNRLEADGRACEVAFTQDPDVIQAWLPDLAAAYRDRDRHHGLTSDLADAAGYERWADRIHRLSRAGDLEVALLHISDVLAAYLIGLVDAGTYRVVEGRFVSAWARYAPGRLLEAQVLQRVLDDDALAALDWMTSVAPQALIALNELDQVAVLTRNA